MGASSGSIPMRGRVVFSGRAADGTTSTTPAVRSTAKAPTNEVARTRAARTKAAGIILMKGRAAVLPRTIGWVAVPIAVGVMIVATDRAMATAEDRIYLAAATMTEAICAFFW